MTGSNNPRPGTLLIFYGSTTGYSSRQNTFIGRVLDPRKTLFLHLPIATGCKPRHNPSELPSAASNPNPVLRMSYEFHVKHEVINAARVVRLRAGEQHHKSNDLTRRGRNRPRALAWTCGFLP